MAEAAAVVAAIDAGRGAEFDLSVYCNKDCGS